jgi:hypothetical protein
MRRSEPLSPCPKKKARPTSAPPQQLGGGRLEIRLPAGWSLQRGELLFEQGEIRIIAEKLGKTQIVRIKQAVQDELAWIELPPGFQNSALKFVPAYDFSKEQLEKVGIRAPETWTVDGVAGCAQKLPEDAPLGIAYRKMGNTVKIASHLGDGYQKECVRLVNSNNIFSLEQTRSAWWRAYWAGVPKVMLPDPVLQELHDYGLYKLACISPPQGVACPLQGPFMEEYQVVDVLARTGQTEAAVNWLHYFKENFTNEGCGTLHNANTDGHSLIGAPQWSKGEGWPNREVIQLDGGMGALTAVYELLVQNRLDGIHVLPERSIHWKNLWFERVRAEGGFSIGARVEKDKVLGIKIQCAAGGPLRLHYGMGEAYLLNGRPQNGRVLERDCKKGETLVLRAK